MIGYIYIAQNVSFSEGLLKIGLCSDVKERLKSLSNSSVPHDYSLVQSFEVNDAQKAERMVFNILSQKRHKKEFYKCSISEAVAACQEVQREINRPICFISKKNPITSEEADSIADMWLHEDMSDEFKFDN